MAFSPVSSMSGPRIQSPSQMSEIQTEQAESPEPQRLHLLGGIDEAGLGPILGPLVVAGMLLEGPAGTNAWADLAACFCKKPASRKDTRVRVDDSKRVKTGKQGLAHLERTALTMHYAKTGRLPETLGEFLDGGLGDLCGELSRYAWYQDLDQVPLPRWNNRGALELTAHLALQEMRKASVQCLAYEFHAVSVGRFNASIQRHDNKSVTLFESSLPPLVSLVEIAARHAHESSQDYSLHVVLDRQGGRSRYRPLLAKAFPGTSILSLREGSSLSEYRLGEHTKLTFVEKGEDRSFPTAAASCLAKYVRELCMERINHYFRGHLPYLKSTAGYYLDGRRFLKDLGPLLAEQKRELLIRNR